MLLKRRRANGWASPFPIYQVVSFQVPLAWDASLFTLDFNHNQFLFFYGLRLVLYEIFFLYNVHVPIEELMLFMSLSHGRRWKCQSICCIANLDSLRNTIAAHPIWSLLREGLLSSLWNLDSLKLMLVCSRGPFEWKSGGLGCIWERQCHRRRPSHAREIYINVHRYVQIGFENFIRSDLLFSTSTIIKFYTNVYGKSNWSDYDWNLLGVIFQTNGKLGKLN